MGLKLHKYVGVYSITKIPDLFPSILLRSNVVWQDVLCTHIEITNLSTL